jgi:hypothetical protein
MEAVFCSAYLIVTGTLGVLMLRAPKNNHRRLRFALLTLVLVCGDAFHLVPRIYGAVTGTTDNLDAVLGFGTFAASITMTVFYVLLWRFWYERTYKNHGVLSIILYFTAACRIILCLFPQNNWLTNETSSIWGILRNIPFVILGGIVVWRLFKDRDVNRYFKNAWFAVTLSFLFYLPVVLFADFIPIIGMLMIPKTICYVWLVVMGYGATKRM